MNMQHRLNFKVSAALSLLTISILSATSLVSTNLNHHTTVAGRSLSTFLDIERASLKNGCCQSIAPIVDSLNHQHLHGKTSLQSISSDKTISVISSVLGVYEHEEAELFYETFTIPANSNPNNILRLYHSLVFLLKHVANDHNIRVANSSSYALIRALNDKSDSELSNMMLNRKIIYLFVMFHQLKTYFTDNVEAGYSFDARYTPTKKYSPTLIAQCARLFFTAIVDEWAQVISKS